MDHIRTKEIEYISDTTMRFGTHVFEKDGFKYIYGKKDTVVDGFKYPVPMLARVESSVDEPWQFYSGNDTWTYNCSEAVPIGDRPMSESFFVHEKDGKYYLLMHEIWLIGELYILESDKLTGPWNRASTGGIEKKFAVIKPHGKNFTYNLFAHPHFKRGNDLLITYNVNNRDFWPIFDDTRHYRARFYWMDIDHAMNAAVPDTLDIWADILGTNAAGPGSATPGPDLRCYGQKLYLENIHPGSLIEIYGTDGRRYISRRMDGNNTLSLEGLPVSVLLVRLSNREGTKGSKVFNSY